MKKIGILVVGLAAIVALGWYAKKLIVGEKNSDTQLIAFAFEDTTKIDKIIITDAFSQRMELIRKGKEWTAGDGSCVTRESVSLIMDAFKKINLKGYLSEKAQKRFTELMSTSHTKVEIFEDGKWSKSWYIGPPAQDHMGQIMLLETAEDGKSDQPVMMSIAGMYGIVEPRFFADKRKWMCTNIFRLEMDDIAEVDVRFPDEKFRNFNIKSKGSRFTVSSNGEKLSQVDTANVYRYLQSYKKVHFDIANFQLNEKQLDSMKRSTPFCVLKVKEKNGKKQQLRMFRIKSEEPQRNEFGEYVNADMNRFWCELSNGEIVKCQYFVFNQLILGHVYFPAMNAKFSDGYKMPM
jgi:hypothetical protein